MSNTRRPNAEKQVSRSRILPTVMIIAAVVLVAVALKLSGSFFSDRFLDDIEAWMASARDTPWAILPVMAVFLGLSFTGFPQFALVALTALVFGPLLGFVYSWVATMISASTHFGLGKRFGNRLLNRYGGERTHVFSRKIAQHGILASAGVRVIPSAPFIVVNTAAGVSHMAYWKFVLGTGLGTVPKTGLISFVGGNVMDILREQNLQDIALVVAIVVLWIALGLLARAYFIPRLRRTAPPAEAEAAEAVEALAVAAEGEAQTETESGAVTQDSAAERLETAGSAPPCGPNRIAAE